MDFLHPFSFSLICCTCTTCTTSITIYEFQNDSILSFSATSFMRISNTLRIHSTQVNVFYTRFDRHRHRELHIRADTPVMVIHDTSTTISIFIFKKIPATSKPYPVGSHHNSLQDRNNGIKGIVMRLSNRSGANGPTNFQSLVIRSLWIHNVWIRFTDVGDHILRNCGCRIWRHGSGNLSHESMLCCV